MNTRFLAVLAAGALVVAGCNRTAGPAGDASLDGITTASVFDQYAYAAGFQTAQQVAQDSALLAQFDFDVFRRGFNEGLAGDSSALAYIAGYEAGSRLRRDTTIRIDPNIFLAAFREGLRPGAESRLTDDDLMRLSAALQDTLTMRDIRTRAAADPGARQRLDIIRANAVRSDSFLAQVDTRPGIRRTNSGVRYTVDRAGSGATPGRNDVVRISYRGALPDGTVFDESAPGQPLEIPVMGVVSGMTEALLQMRVGEKRTLYLPPNQAYGLQGVDAPEGRVSIPPNTALVFEVTLESIQPGGQGMPGMQGIR